MKSSVGGVQETRFITEGDLSACILWETVIPKRISGIPSGVPADMSEAVTAGRCIRDLASIC